MYDKYRDKALGTLYLWYLSRYRLDLYKTFSNKGVYNFSLGGSQPSKILFFRDRIVFSKMFFYVSI